MKRLLPLLVCLLLAASSALQSQSVSRSSAEQRFNTAMQAMRAGDYAGAERSLHDILREQPNNPAVLANLGVLYSKTQRYTEAVDAYKHALRAAPAQEPVQLNLGLAYLKQDDYGKALAYFSHLHEVHPAEAQFTILTATCLTYTGKAQDAIAMLQPIATPDENRAALYILGIAYMRADQPDTAREVLNQVFAGASPAQASFLLGEAFANATDYTAAAQAFQAALSHDPNLPGAHRELGRTYLGLHQNADAERELRLAVQTDARDSTALYSLGALLAQGSRFADARPVLEQAQQAAPDSWATAFYLGKCAYELHDMSMAERQLRRAAELNPDEPGAPYLLSRLLRGQGHMDEANQWMQRVSAQAVSRPRRHHRRNNWI